MNIVVWAVHLVLFVSVIVNIYSRDFIDKELIDTKAFEDYVLAKLIEPEMQSDLDELQNYWYCDDVFDCYNVIVKEVISQIQLVSLLGIGLAVFSLYVIFS